MKLGSALPASFRLLVLAMLGIIALQALPTKPLSAETRYGSAFSADTAEVSLSTRHEVNSRASLVQLPSTLFAHIAPPVRLSGAEAKGPSHIWPGRRQTAPPVPWPHSPAEGPRAPPLKS
ncbi:hypothetical protein FHS61_002340 [Altererythrobacter atlanticus]|uniref:hypothetical protein n=1 Tax=Croceibacterium atlanticum TaxID=1267766 RepID=UPI0012E13E4E|nr:hypothetical protein [Croceibacterium atlanticum]MBB5733305.1 hypothetical protein [Croceibacterium atlanticum]